ncbi:fatty acid desaturase, partial [Frankia sp. CpI1-P]
ASNSRSVRSNPLIRFVIWNANYHAEHHAVPWVAAVNLPLLHKAMRGVEYRRERSYLAFHLGLLRSLRGAGHARE